MRCLIISLDFFITDDCGSEWVGVDGSWVGIGWEWVGMGGSGWELVGMGVSGWEHCLVTPFFNRFNKFFQMILIIYYHSSGISSFFNQRIFLCFVVDAVQFHYNGYIHPMLQKEFRYRISNIFLIVLSCNQKYCH